MVYLLCIISYILEKVGNNMSLIYWETTKYLADIHVTPGWFAKEFDKVLGLDTSNSR